VHTFRGSDRHQAEAEKEGRGGLPSADQRDEGAGSGKCDDAFFSAVSYRGEDEGNGREQGEHLSEQGDKAARDEQTHGLHGCDE
jgi:hypothetical protein